MCTYFVCTYSKKGETFFGPSFPQCNLSRSIVNWSGAVFYCGVFNLHLLEFTFVYQFYSRKTTLVESTFWNPVGLFAFMAFHNHFKIFWYCVLLEMTGIFCPYLFWDRANGIWTDNIQSFEVSFHLSFELQI